MKASGGILIGSLAAIAGVLALVYALHLLMTPFDPANLPVVAGGVIVYVLAWLVSLWTIPH